MQKAEPGRGWHKGFLSNEGPHVYETERGDKYDVTAVTYKCGQRVEEGRIVFANGDSYEGQWSMGAKNGSGKYRCASGVTYEGRWKDDMRHGYS
jgi:hypothetical protein